MRFGSLLVFFIGINLHVFSQQNTTQENAWEWLKERNLKFTVDTLDLDLYQVKYFDQSQNKHGQFIVFKNEITNWYLLNNKLLVSSDEIDDPKSRRKKVIGKTIINSTGDTLLNIAFNHENDLVSPVGNHLFKYRKVDLEKGTCLFYVYDESGKPIPLPIENDYNLYSDSLLIATFSSFVPITQIFVGLYSIDGRCIIPVKYERIQMLSDGYFCCRTSDVNKSTNKVPNDRAENDIPVPDDSYAINGFIIEQTSHFCLIDASGKIVPNSQKTIKEKFDYRRTVEEEHKAYLAWLEDTLKMKLKVQYPQINSRY
jgi:hypothetical protein